MAKKKQPPSPKKRFFFGGFGGKVVTTPPQPGRTLGSRPRDCHHGSVAMVKRFVEDEKKPMEV